MAGLAANRRSFPTLGLLLLAFFLAAGGFRAAAQISVTKEGRRVEIWLSADKPAIMLGEPTYVSLEIKNYSSLDLCVGLGGDYRNNLGRPNSFKVTVTRVDGKAVPQPEVTFSSGGFLSCERAPAHGSHSIKLFLPHWATFEEPGSYVINVKRRLPIFYFKEEPSPEVFPDPDLVLQADLSTGIEVVPPDEDRLGDVIKLFGATMLDASNPECRAAALALARIDDKRVISYFAQALEQFRDYGFGEGMNEFGISLQAVEALAKFNDDSALAALEAAMRSRSKDTRLNVASGLSSSPHPKAIGLLLRMRGDSYWFVRLRVAQALGKLESEESLALLRGMLGDKNEEVRKAARAGLKERSKKK